MPDESDRAALGRRGENAAADHLAARGYQIVARNVRVDRVELDLIARRGETIVFVEVKSRRGVGHGLAAEAVDARKQRRLRHGALAWLATRPAEARGARRHRFDVVTCVLREIGARNETSAPEPARWSIEHWESAF
ncbi:MAG: YraN family protein [Myxococcota bacterium]